jgi:hypothetical protein
MLEKFPMRRYIGKEDGKKQTEKTNRMMCGMKIFKILHLYGFLTLKYSVSACVRNHTNENI